MSTIRFELDREEDGRWWVDVIDHPGVMAYGHTPPEALVNALTLLAFQAAEEEAAEVKAMLESAACKAPETDEDL